MQHGTSTQLLLLGTADDEKITRRFKLPKSSAEQKHNSIGNHCSHRPLSVSSEWVTHAHTHLSPQSNIRRNEERKKTEIRVTFSFVRHLWRSFTHQWSSSAGVCGNISVCRTHTAHRTVVVVRCRKPNCDCQTHVYGILCTTQSYSRTHYITRQFVFMRPTEYRKCSKYDDSVMRPDSCRAVVSVCGDRTVLRPTKTPK